MKELEHVITVKVESLERENSWSSIVKVQANRSFGSLGKDTEVSWYVTGAESKKMFIGQEFELIIKPSIQEEPIDVLNFEPGRIEQETTNPSETSS